MLIITLILYGFMLLYTTVICFRYYRTRRFLKKREKIIRSQLIPQRVITPEETAGARRYFGIPLPADAEVYRTEGVFEWITMKNRYGTYNEFWIGGIQIQFRKGEMEKLFHKEDRYALCEYAILPGDRRMKAYPLKINSYTISDRFGRERRDNILPPYASCSFRDGAKRESRALLRPLFQEILLLALPALLSLTIAVYTASEEGLRGSVLFLAAGLFLGALSLLPLVLPPRYPKGRKEICTVTGTLERIEKRGKLSPFCRLKGTEDLFRIPRRTLPLFSGSGYSGRMELYLKGGKRAGRLVSLGPWSLDERLGAKLIKRPLPWLLCGSLLLLLGIIHFFSVMGDKNGDVLTALPRNIQEGPLLIENAGETLPLRGGETVEFHDLTVHRLTPYSSDYLPLADSGQLYDLFSERDEERLRALFESWQELTGILSRTVCFRDGSPLFLIDEDAKKTIAPGESIGILEEGILRTTDNRKLYRMDLPPMVCTDPEALITFLSRKDTPIGAVEPDSFTRDSIHGGKYLNTFISWLIVRYKTELIREAENICLYGGRELDDTGGIPPYPVLVGFYFHGPLDADEPQGPYREIQIQLPLEENVRETIIRGRGGIETLNGKYYLESEIDYSQYSSRQGKSYRGLITAPFSRYPLFLRRIILSLSFIGAGFLILISGLVSKLRD